jgi:hypothetical protein
MKDFECHMDIASGADTGIKTISCSYYDLKAAQMLGIEDFDEFEREIEEIRRVSFFLKTIKIIRREYGNCPTDNINNTCYRGVACVE